MRHLNSSVNRITETADVPSRVLAAAYNRYNLPGESPARFTRVEPIGNIQPSVEECNPTAWRSDNRFRQASVRIIVVSAGNCKGQMCPLPADISNIGCRTIILDTINSLGPGSPPEDSWKRSEVYSLAGIGSPDGGRARNLRLERAKYKIILV